MIKIVFVHKLPNMDQQEYQTEADSYDEDLRAFREASVSDVPVGDTAAAAAVAAASSSSFLYHNSEELEDMLVDTLDHMKLGTQTAPVVPPAGSSNNKTSTLGEDRSLRMSFGCWTAEDKRKWTCNACTFVNEALHLTCTVCEKPKGLSALGNSSSNDIAMNGSSAISLSDRGMESSQNSSATNHNSNDKDYDPFLEQLRQERKAEVLELQQSILRQAAMEVSQRGVDDSNGRSQPSSRFNNQTLETLGVNGSNSNNTSRRSPVPSCAPFSPAPSIPVPPRAMPPLLADRSVAPLSPARQARQARRQQRSPPCVGRARDPLLSEEHEVFNMSEQEAKEMRKIVAMQSTTASSSSSGDAKSSPTPALKPKISKSKPSPVLAARCIAIHDMPDRPLSSAGATAPIRTPALPLRPQQRVNNHRPSDYGESLDPDILEKIAMRDGSNREDNQNQQHQAYTAAQPGAYHAKTGAQATAVANLPASRQQSTRPARRRKESPLAAANTVSAARKAPYRACSPTVEHIEGTLDADVLEKIARFSREGTSNNGPATDTGASAPQEQSQPGAYRNQPGAAAVRNTSVTQNMKGGIPKPAAHSTPATSANVTQVVETARVECATVVSPPAITDAEAFNATAWSTTEIGEQVSSNSGSGKKPPPENSPLTRSPTRKRDKVKNAARDIFKNGLTFRKSKTK